MRSFGCAWAGKTHYSPRLFFYIRDISPIYPPLPGPLNPLPQWPRVFFAIWAEQLLANFFPQKIESKNKGTTFCKNFSPFFFTPKSNPIEKGKIPGGNHLYKVGIAKKFFHEIFRLKKSAHLLYGRIVK